MTTLWALVRCRVNGAFCRVKRTKKQGHARNAFCCVAALAPIGKRTKQTAAVVTAPIALQAGACGIGALPSTQDGSAGAGGMKPLLSLLGGGLTLPAL
jgi:hypothetical protein